MHRLTVRAAAALLCLLTAMSAHATDTPAPFATYGEATQAVDLSGPVTLQGCVALALGRNFTVRIQQYTVLEAIDQVDIQKAVFEPVFGVNVNKQVNQAVINESEFGVPDNTSTTTAAFTV